MVAQQLTPELTQPSVLVEIDHGPPMGLYQEPQGPEPGNRQVKTAESMSIGHVASVSTSTARPAVEFDGCPEPRVEYDGITSIGTHSDSDGTKIEVLEGSNFIRSHDPVSSDAYQLGTGKKETVVAGATRFKSNEASEWMAAGSYSMSKSSGNGKSYQDLVRRPAVPHLPAHGSSAAESLSKSTDMASSQGESESLLSEWDQSETLFQEYALGDRRFNGDGKPDTMFISNEWTMVDADKAFAFGNPKSLVYHYVGQGATSWAAGSEKGFSVGTEEIAREIFMWMFEYNLVSYSAP